MKKEDFNMSGKAKFFLFLGCFALAVLTYIIISL